MQITSPVFKNTDSIPEKFTCDGENISPPFFISDIHPSTKSLVLIVDDPDAPGGTWTHWVVWNIRPSTAFISEGSIPDGAIEGLTDFGRKGYGGPCPHQGTHRYFFKVYVLDTVLNIPLTSVVEDVEEAMKGHLVADAKLMGTYSRK